MDHKDEVENAVRRLVVHWCYTGITGIICITRITSIIRTYVTDLERTGWLSCPVNSTYSLPSLPPPYLLSNRLSLFFLFRSCHPVSFFQLLFHWLIFSFPLFSFVLYVWTNDLQGIKRKMGRISSSCRNSLSRNFVEGKRLRDILEVRHSKKDPLKAVQRRPLRTGPPSSAFVCRNRCNERCAIVLHPEASLTPMKFLLLPFERSFRKYRLFHFSMFISNWISVYANKGRKKERDRNE